MDPCPVLVGRERELGILRSLLDSGGGVAIVSGEAGIGKSRLVRELAAEAAAGGRIVLWARPEEVAQPGPYALIVDLVASIAERAAGSVSADTRALVSQLSRTGEDGRGPAPAPRAVAAEVRGLMAQLGAPPLVVLEDLHWADEASHAVVLHLARASRDDRHVVVATLRSEGPASEASLARLLGSLARERAAVEIALEPLPAEAMARMLEMIWQRPPSEAEVAEIVRLGEGVPFFVEELATAGHDGERVRVPKSIEQSVTARLTELGAEAIEVLRAASLMAGALDVAVLAEACALPADRVTDHLTAGARAGLLTDVEGRLLFRHSLVREVIAGGLISVEAARIHGRLATAIEKVHGDELEAFAAALAVHHREAGDKQAAVRYAIRSGERALALGATEEARSAFSSALQLDPTSVEALRGLAEAEFRDANETEAAILFRRAADELREQGRTGEAARVLARLSWALKGMATPTEVLEVLDEALALVAEEADRLEAARLMVQKGSMQCFLLNQAAMATPTLTQALQLAQGVADFALIAEALDGLAQARELEGDLAEALRLSAQAVEAARQSGEVEALGRTHNNYALKLAISGRPAEALDVLAQGRRHLDQAHGRAAVGALDVSRAWVLWLMGRPNTVAELTARGRVAWQRWRGYRWLMEAWSAVERDDRSRAEAVVHEAWAALGGEALRDELLASPSTWTRETAAAFYADVLFAMRYGAADADENLNARSLDALVIYGRSAADEFDFGQMLSFRAQSMISLGRLASAEESLEELRALVQRHAYPYLQAAIHEIEAGLAIVRKDSRAAVSCLKEAVEVLAGCLNMSDQARCRRLLAEALTEIGSEQRAEAREHLKAARRLAEESGALHEINRIDALARAQGLRLRSGRIKGAGSGTQLSPREIEVVALVAEGETNAGIARRLYLSERTVQDHITHALRKLHLASRAALASWAARNGLL